MLRRLLTKWGNSARHRRNNDTDDDAERKTKTRHLSCPRCRRVLIIPRAERFRCQCSMVFRVTGADKIQLCLASSNPDALNGLPRRLIDRMPIIMVDEAACSAAATTASAAVGGDTDPNNCNKTCRICLSDYKAGDSIRVLPCFHRFHSDEIDDWLKKNTTCPLCHLDVSEALTGSSGVAFVTAMEGNPMPYLDRTRG